LIQDAAQLEVARQAAMEIIAADPLLARPEHQGMLERVRERRSEMAVAVIS
jgi:hypothetical protein